MSKATTDLCVVHSYLYEFISAEENKSTGGDLFSLKIALKWLETAIEKLGERVPDYCLELDSEGR